MRTPGILNVIDFTARDGWFNMALDYHLFSLCESGLDEAFLRLYAWDPPALSLGFHEHARIVDTEAAGRDGVDVVRRPTGGRVVLHKSDLTYTVVLPMAPAGGAGGGPAGVAGIYRLVSECIVRGLNTIGPELAIDRGKVRAGLDGSKPCFASTSRYEITHRGRKVVGSAQRVGRRSVLQHGSIPVGTGYLDVVEYLKGVNRGRLRDEVQKSTTCLERVAGGKVNIREIAQDLREAFAAGLSLQPTHKYADIYLEDITRLNESLVRGAYPVTYGDKIT